MHYHCTAGAVIFSGSKSGEWIFVTPSLEKIFVLSKRTVFLVVVNFVFHADRADCAELSTNTFRLRYLRNPREIL
jgi:hypothetical protein